MTSAKSRVQRRLIELDVELVTAHNLARFNGSEAEIHCTYSDRSRTIAVKAVVTVTMREPDDALFHKLQHRIDNASDVDYRPLSLTRIGDCEAPSIIAGAVFSGHRYARELDTEVDVDNRIKYDRVFFDDA